MKKEILAKSKIKEIGLSPAEKEALRERLMAYAAARPPVGETERVWGGFWHVFQSRLAASMAVLVLLIAAGTGLSWAAEDSLPGDALYPLKINFTEAIRDMLSSNNIAQALWEAQKTERRLAEAEGLAARNRLDINLLQNIEVYLDKYLKSFESFVQEKKTDSAGSVVEAMVDFEAKVNAHGKILEKIEKHAAEPQKEKVGKLRNLVKEKANEVAQKRLGAEEAFVKASEEKSEEDKNKDLFETKKQELESMIKEVRENLDAAKAGGQAATPVQQEILNDSEAAAAAAAEELKTADENKNSGGWGQALPALLKSQQAVEEASISLKQGLKLGE